jgi:hypothetical protein
MAITQLSGDTATLSVEPPLKQVVKQDRETLPRGWSDPRGFPGFGGSFAG